MFRVGEFGRKRCFLSTKAGRRYYYPKLFHFGVIAVAFKLAPWRSFSGHLWARQEAKEGNEQ